MSRPRPARALSLLLCVALFGSAFVANADAKHLSKAQKHAISKKLLKAVKKNPRVISKRWFLKKASLVSFSLPSTIRLTPAKDQNGNYITNDTTKNTAVLNLGPSLGSRTIGLTGALHANINFNDAFDGGSLGDVKISLPADTSALTTTGVPLLTNSNARASSPQIAPEAELINMIIPNAAAGATLAITNGHTGTVITAPFAVTGPGTGGAPTAFDTALLASAQAALSPAGNYANAVGLGGVYEYSAPFAAATGPLSVPAACPVGAPGVYQCTVVSLVFTGKDAGGANQNGVPWLPEFPSGSALPAASFPDWRLAKTANGDTADNTAPVLNAGSVVLPGPFTLSPIGASVRATKGVKDSDGMGGCGSFEGNGTGSTGNGPLGFSASSPSARDTDFVSNLVGTSLDNSSNDVNQMGPGPFDGLGGASTAVPGDVVLRTPPLKLSIAAPGTVDAPGDNTDNPGGTLTAGYTAGGLSITVDDASGFHVGNPITVSDGFNQSLATVTGVNTTTNVLTLAGQLLPAHSYAADSTNVQITSSGVVKKVIGASGGRANLFGAPVNGLSNGNSVDVTVNLGLDLTAISRQVDGAFPEPAGPGNVNEKTGNISAYFNCRQAWTGNIRNYLNGIKLVGALRISPAVTADGKVRIAKVALRTPQPVPAQLAACLQPHQLYMSGNPLLADPAGFTVGPQLLPITGDFNPLAILLASGIPDPANAAHNFLSNSAAPTNTPCNSTGGPLNRDPFNVSPKAGGTGLSNLLNSGAAVGVSGNISTKIQAGVIIGNFTN
jgi:hypothetical protein